MPYKDKNKQKEHYLKNKERILARYRARYAENPELFIERSKNNFKNDKANILQKMKVYRAKNKEKVNAGIEAWLSIPENKEHVRLYKKEWYKKWLANNKGKKNAQTAKRCAIKLAATPADADMKKIEEFYLLAERLTEQTGIIYSVDHIKPLSKGGKHHQDNLQVITLNENIIKSDKYPYEIPSKMYFFPSPDYLAHA